MSKMAAVQMIGKAATSESSWPLLQRTCACGETAGLSGDCEECKTKKFLGKPLRQKLAISQPGDEFEREADRVAAQVMKMPDQPGNRALRKTGDNPLVQRRAAASSGTTAGYAPPIVHDVLAQPGQPLDATARTFFEPRFGHDFSRVRVHADAQAAESAKAVNAIAYTVGSDIAFAAGQYRAGTIEGLRLLAHELTHVVQQQTDPSAPRSSPLRRTVSFANGSVSETLNLADRVLNNMSAGETDFVLNGATFTNLNDGLQALHVPRIKSSPRGRKVRCSFASVPDNEVSFAMRILSPDPWSSTTTKGVIGNLLPGLNAACHGSDAATFTVQGMPTNQDQRARTRTHEDHHVDDYKSILQDLIEPWDKAVAAAYKRRKTATGSDKDQCTGELYDQAVGQNQRPDDVVTAVIHAINDKARLFHASAAGRNVRISNVNTDAGCNRVTAEAR